MLLPNFRHEKIPGEALFGLIYFTISKTSCQASLDMKASFFWGVRGCNTLHCSEIESICSNIALSLLLKKMFPVFK